MPRLPRCPRNTHSPTKWLSPTENKCFCFYIRAKVSGRRRLVAKLPMINVPNPYICGIVPKVFFRIHTLIYDEHMWELIAIDATRFLRIRGRSNLFVFMPLGILISLRDGLKLKLWSCYYLTSSLDRSIN